MTKYAQNTSVSVARSKAEIEDILTKYGATGFVTGWNEQGAAVGFVMQGKQIKFLLPLPDKSAREFTHVKVSQYTDKPRSPDKVMQAWEQACRQRWRALVLCIKAKLEAVSQGITSFEHEFLAHFVIKNNQTVGDLLIPHLEKAQLEGKLPQLTLGM